MYHVSVKDSQHSWTKKNLFTIMGRKGAYDVVVCDNCGIKGRRYSLDSVAIDERYSLTKAQKCAAAPDFIVPLRIEVIHCAAYGPMFENIKPGSCHEVVDPPASFKNDHSGVWVMGVGEPVKVLRGEYLPVEYKIK